MLPYVKKQSKDYRTKYKNVEVKYDGTNKTVCFTCSRVAMLPAYCYYLCQHLETQFKEEIRKVIFLLDTSRAYRVEELKGVQDWNDIDELDGGKINESK